MESRDKKRLVIISAYAFVFILVVILVILKMIPNQTCSDGVKNQNEDGADCGGVCQQACVVKLDDLMTVSEAGFAESGLANKYDLYGIIVNPNREFGSDVFDYVFSLKDSLGNTVAQKEGRSFILPGEKKYLAELGVESLAVPAKAELAIKNISWKEFSDFEKPEIKIVNKNYSEDDQGGKVSGVVRNESPFDFNEINITAILRDKLGKVTAVNLTKINTVQAGESREFNFLWPDKTSRSVSTMEIQAETNVFRDDAFVKRYFPGQTF